MPLTHNLSLYCRSSCTFDKVALEDKEENQHGDGVEHRTCQEHIIFRVVGTLKVVEAHRERIHLAAIHDQQRPEEVVPCSLEAENCHSGHSWFYQGHNDLVEDAPAVCPIDFEQTLLIPWEDPS